MKEYFSLKNIRALMDELTDAHIKLPVISVAGTNGKGSVSSFISSVLNVSEIRSGLYTSPHISSFTERIKLNGENIPPGRFKSLYRKVLTESKSAGFNLTKFERLTAAALLYFREEDARISVMEVGLGGRLDATNICENKLVSVITSISKDHMEYLGDDIEKIALEKAGIIREGYPVVDASYTQAVSFAAEKLSSPVYRSGKEYHIENIRGLGEGKYTYNFIMGGKTIKDITPGIRGRYQVENSAAAAAACLLIGMDEESIAEGLSRTKNHGRLELFRTKEGKKILIDAAHNPAGIRSLVSFLKELDGVERRHFIVGVLKDKNYREMAEVLYEESDLSWAVTPESSRGLPASELALLLNNSRVSESIRSAIEDAYSSMKENDLLIICGTFLIIKEALEYAYAKSA